MTRPRPTAADAPLFAWGDALRRARLRRRRLARRATLLAVGTLILLGTATWPPVPRLLWNASPSAPKGLYRVRPGAALREGDMVAAWPPAEARRVAAARRYLPANVPLVKHVAARAGDEVCARGGAILLNGGVIAMRRAVDGRGRPMPWWTGCRRLRGDQLFLLMTAHPASFDGRYFGPSDAHDVIGRAQPLWTW